MRGSLNKIAAILWKDIRSEWRSKEFFSAMFIFAALTIFVFNFAFELHISNRKAVVPGIMWVAFAFAGELGLSRSFALEQDKGSFSGLLLAPGDRSAIYVAKALGNILFMLVSEAFLLPMIMALFNVNLANTTILLTVLAGTIGFASVGTLISAIAVNTRAREVLLPVLLFPVVLPVLIAAVYLTSGALNGASAAELAGWWKLLLTYDLFFIVLSVMVFDFVVEE